jgi:hypothetical protein
MTVNQLIEQLTLLDAPNAEVQVVIKEPYDDEAEILEEDLETVVLEKTVFDGKPQTSVRLKAYGVDE